MGSLATVFPLNVLLPHFVVHTIEHTLLPKIASLQCWVVMPKLLLPNFLATTTVICVWMYSTSNSKLLLPTLFFHSFINTKLSGILDLSSTLSLSSLIHNRIIHQLLQLSSLKHHRIIHHLDLSSNLSLSTLSIFQFF